MAASLECDDDVNCDDGRLRRRRQKVRIPDTGTLTVADALTVSITSAVNIACSIAVAITDSNDRDKGNTDANDRGQRNTDAN